MDGRGGLSAALNKKKTRRAYQSISMETEREGGGERGGEWLGGEKERR